MTGGMMRWEHAGRRCRGIGEDVKDRGASPERIAISHFRQQRKPIADALREAIEKYQAKAALKA
jgi:hypothetical protein